MAKPRVPAGLGKHGKALWRKITGDLADDMELDARELHYLERAAKIADNLADLRAAIDRDGLMVTGSRGQVIAHPAQSEARQLEVVQLRLLSAIQFIDPEAERAATPSQARGRRAARLRHAYRENGAAFGT